ncbi:MAG TPA: hypothetical protein PLD30_02090 [Candidatus Competibacteraceae bacterium]|nr:hypothetical protein [Candidatus Competibacteraceae bacterium]
MSSVLQQIAEQFECIDPDKANELRRIEQVYTHFGFDDSIAAQAGDKESATRRLLHYLPRMARMKDFRLYRIGVGEQENGGYAHQAIALLDAHHLPTPGNTLAVLDPIGAETSTTPSASDDVSHQYFFEVWQTLQHYYGRGCALIPDNERSRSTQAAGQPAKNSTQQVAGYVSERNRTSTQSVC